MSNYFLTPDVLAEARVPEKGILSQTLHNDDHVKVILFGFAEGQELSAHTAPFPAMLYFVQGQAALTLGDDAREAAAGTLVHMPPNLTHGIVAKKPLVMLLVMFKSARA